MKIMFLTSPSAGPMCFRSMTLASSKAFIGFTMVARTLTKPERLVIVRSVAAVSVGGDVVHVVGVGPGAGVES